MKHVVIDAAIDAYLSETPRCFKMADLGCSSGTNALSLIGDIVNAIDERCHEKTRQVPQFMVFLNDLPGNDFNSIFISFSDFGSRLKNVRRRDEFHSVFMAGVPGSFYGRLFPSNSLHFIHSSHKHFDHGNGPLLRSAKQFCSPQYCISVNCNYDTLSTWSLHLRIPKMERYYDRPASWHYLSILQLQVDIHGAIHPFHVLPWLHQAKQLIWKIQCWLPLPHVQLVQSVLSLVVRGVLVVQ